MRAKDKCPQAPPQAWVEPLTPQPAQAPLDRAAGATGSAAREVGRGRGPGLPRRAALPSGFERVTEPD